MLLTGNWRCQTQPWREPFVVLVITGIQQDLGNPWGSEEGPSDTAAGAARIPEPRRAHCGTKLPPHRLQFHTRRLCGATNEGTGLIAAGPTAPSSGVEAGSAPCIPRGERPRSQHLLGVCLSFLPIHTLPPPPSSLFYPSICTGLKIGLQPDFICSS